MRAMCWGSLAVCFAVLAGPLQADDRADATAVIDKALKAMGGGEKVAKFSAGTFQCKITHDHNGQQATIDAAGTWQGHDKVRLGGEFTIGGDSGKILMVINGDDGWMKKNEQVLDAPQGLVPALKSAFYAMRMPYLLPSLKDKAFTLARKGEEKVNDKDAVALSVSHKDHQEVTVLFDKKTGLPLKSQTRVNGPDGNEVAVEFFYADYREVNGIKHPMKITLKGDGNEYIIELGEIQSKDKVDASEFAKP